MSRYRIIVPGSATFIPKMEFLSEWGVWLYIRSVLGDKQIPGIKTEPIGVNHEQ